MYEGETEPIPRVTDRGEPDVRDRPARTGHGHGHHHDHGPPLPASRRVRTLVAILLVPFALAALVGTVLLFPFGDGPQTQGGAGRPVHGVITSTETGSCTAQVQVGEVQPGAPECLVVGVRMTDGDAPGAEISMIVPQEPSTPRFAVDDEVVLSYGGSDPRQGGSYQLVDFQREVPLALLAGLFAVAVLVLSRWQGLKALVALGLSFLVLVFFVLPAILAGESPLLVAICGAGVIMFAVLYLTHGFSARTSTAALGTMVSLALIGVLGAAWAAFAKLTGLDEETATLVGLLNAPIDTRGLLLAGVVIGALGVLDDVTVTQTSAVWELRAANPLLTKKELYTSALRIGRDHVASAVNTLVMAYAGAALPLLLYSSISGVGLGSILTSQSIAQELVRTLVGSIGLVAAVPITTALAAAVAAQEPPPESARRRAPRSSDRDGGVRPAARADDRRGGRRDDRSGERLGERSDGRPIGGRGGRPGERPSGDRDGRPSGRSSGGRGAGPGERSGGVTGGQPSERLSGGQGGQPSERLSGGQGGGPSDRPGGVAGGRQGRRQGQRTGERSGERQDGRPGGQWSDRTGGWDVEQPDRRTDHPASRKERDGRTSASARPTRAGEPTPSPEGPAGNTRALNDALPRRVADGPNAEQPGRAPHPPARPVEPTGEQSQPAWFDDDLE